MVVVGEDDATAVETVCKIQDVVCAVLCVDLFTFTLSDGWRGDDAIHPESGNTTVGNHVKLDVSVVFVSLALCDLEEMPLGRATWGDGDDAFPSWVVLGQCVASGSFFFGGEGESVDGDLGCLVAVEVGGVNVEADQATTGVGTEAKDDPVVGRIVTASLPTIEEGTLRTELTFERGRRTDFEKRRGGSEPFVRSAKDATTKRYRGDLGGGGAKDGVELFERDGSHLCKLLSLRLGLEE